ncbi:sortase, partial [candidate division WWE3 bacterium]|nr:sortase [candidate division WWE3 bacterium]
MNTFLLKYKQWKAKASQSSSRSRKIVGVSFVIAALSIFVYLSWYYFVMPRLIIDEKDTLASAFETGRFLSLYDRYQNTSSTRQGKNGVVIGGVLYPREFGNDDEDEFSVLARRDGPPQNVTLTIPELDIYDAAVELNVDGTNEGIYQNVLRRAVAHFASTAYPGDKGNMFLFGHSKIPILAGSDYESIFTNLPRLKNGATIEVKEEGTTFRYRVSSTAVLSPRDVFILNQPREARLLTLMTCIPPGFGSDRYVAVAN